MSLKQLRIYLPLVVALSFAAPSLCRAGVITVNGTCEVGNCMSPNALAYGSSTGTKFDFVYSLPNSDTFRILGLYSASSGSTGTHIEFNVRARYLGNATHSASGNDTLTVDLLQVYGYPFNLDGTYSYSNAFTIGPFVAPTSSVQTDLFYDGQDVGTIGPFTGVGPHSGCASADLTGLTHPLSADYRYTFFIAAGSIHPTSAVEGEDSDDSDGVQVSGKASSLLKGDDHE